MTAACSIDCCCGPNTYWSSFPCGKVSQSFPLPIPKLNALVSLQVLGLLLLSFIVHFIHHLTIHRTINYGNEEDEISSQLTTSTMDISRYTLTAKDIDELSWWNTKGIS